MIKKAKLAAVRASHNPSFSMDMGVNVNKNNVGIDREQIIVSKIVFQFLPVVMNLCAPV